MLHKISILFALLALASGVYAQSEPETESAPAAESMPATTPAPAPESAPVQVNPDNPGQYVVQKGDTLWAIAGRFLTQPWRWTEIWKANPQVQNPNLIYPGDVITLSYEGGNPVLTASRGGSGGGASGGRSERLSPEIRSHERRQAIPTIPIDVIRQFLSRPLVVTEGEMDGWPYVVSSYDQHLVAGPGNRVYVRGLSDQGVRTYSLYRKGPAYHKGAVESSTLLGYEAIYVGEVVIEAFGDPATAMVTQASREVLNGDRLVVRPDQEVTSDFLPHPSAGDVQGSIISVIDGVMEIGQYQVVVLDVGSAQGIEIGNVLGVFQTGKVVTDKVRQNETSVHPFIDYLGTGQSGGEQVTLPPQSAGVVMVFRTFQNISYALVMKATGALKLRDTVRNI